MIVSKKGSTRKADRQVRVASLYLKGRLQSEIAAEEKVSQRTVIRDLVEIRSEWLASRVRDFDQAKEVELRKIDEVEREAWEAWSRSQMDAESVKTIESEDGPRTEKTAKGQVGDPRFLDAIQKCIERRCKILGLDAAERIEHSGQIETIVQEVVVESREEVHSVVMVNGNKYLPK